MPFPRWTSYIITAALGVAVGVAASQDDPEPSDRSEVASPRTLVTTTTVVRSEPSPKLLAVSPDGRRLLRGVPVPAGRGPHLLVSDDVELVDRHTGRVLARANALELGQEAFYEGVWFEDRVALSDGRVDGGSSHPRPTVTVIEVRGDRLVGLATWQFDEVEVTFASIDHLQFIDSRTVTGTISNPAPAVAHFRCSIDVTACTSDWGSGRTAA